MMNKGRATQAIFRIGKFGIRQIPCNIIVGEYSLVTSGPNQGMERMKSNTETYHTNYERALGNLIDRLIEDKMEKSSIDMLKGLIKSIAEVKAELYKVLKESPLIE